MNGKKAKALRNLARQSASREPGYRSDQPKGLTKKALNPAYVPGGVAPKWFVVQHPGTLRHQHASYGSLYRKLKKMSKQPGHYFSVGDQRVSVRQLRNFQLWQGKGVV